MGKFVVEPIYLILKTKIIICFSPNLPKIGPDGLRLHSLSPQHGLHSAALTRYTPHIEVHYRASAVQGNHMGTRIACFGRKVCTFNSQHRLQNALPQDLHLAD